MVANMTTFDIEKFKMQRFKAYYTLMTKLSKDELENQKTRGEYYEYLIQIVR